ncbi:MAG: hypothetical protein ACI8X5_001194 [Planctomycetota bacterium]|jgi:uncharacterized protein YdiU (UPF0061 family)
MVGEDPTMHLSRLDKLPLVHGYAGLGSEFSSSVRPRGLRGAELLHLSRAGCELLDLDPESLDPERAAAWFAGGEPLPGSQPISTVYSGHQFGIWAGQLGDGRAMLLGEVTNARGETWDVQLKGSGPTPYSRSGDGRAVLRSTIREYIAGEALAGLGIPTTRALAIFRSDEDIYREETEKGAVLVRLGQCHVRFGSFEHFHSIRRDDLVRVLFGYSLARWFPELAGHSDRAWGFLEAVTERTARLMAMWMSVGFCHGVMNTDNFSILGDTIDYGPYAFMDDVVWDYICNCSDYNGRYTYAKQPQVGLWNLQRLTEALGALFEGQSLEGIHERVTASYSAVFEREYKERMANKLGLDVAASGFGEVLNSTLSLLGGSATDFNCFWRELSNTAATGDASNLRARLKGSEQFEAWWQSYWTLRCSHPAGGSFESSQKLMLATNPKFVARNYILQEIIEEPDSTRQGLRIDDLLKVLATPFEEHPEHEALSLAPRGAQKALSIGCSS